jgi:hypothetical protein
MLYRSTRPISSTQSHVGQTIALIWRIGLARSRSLRRTMLSCVSWAFEAEDILTAFKLKKTAGKGSGLIDTVLYRFLEEKKLVP